MKTNNLVKILLSLTLTMLTAGTAMAAITGVACVECHTMHNSQDNKVMRWDQDPNASGLEGARALLRAGECIGCHASDTITNDGTNAIPQIDGNIYDPTSGNTVASGSFFWVNQSGGDAKGHNVDEFGINGSNIDAVLGKTPPGWDKDHPGAPNGDAEWVNQLSCAGTYGCHGTRDTDDSFGAVQGAHHESNTVIDGSTVGKSYRFLTAVVGYEDPKWEYRPTTTEHNVYKGTDRNGGSNDDASTISYLCAQCHGKFHTKEGIKGSQSATMTNPWLRHPTDIDMRLLPNGVEYDDYVWDQEAPAALSVIVEPTAADYDAEAIVTCVSCHRAHGSPHDDMLRWDYANMKAGTDSQFAGTGCFRCHTTKDGI